MEFESVQELKDRVMPALKMKEEKLKSEGFDFSSEDIWFYLKQNKWTKSRNLTLNEIVNDILKLDGATLNTRGDYFG